MTKQEIITLCNGGFLAATGHSLPVEHFYKFHRFKRSVAKAYTAIGQEQASLLKDCGLTPEEFGKAGEERERFDTSNAQLLAEDADISAKARIPMAFYKGLYDENKTDKGDLFANIELEILVLDNLFMKEDEDDEK